jgi:glyoxylase-like metal-dependent hydrolase (beta-lactamase superfamily II)
VEGTLAETDVRLGEHVTVIIGAAGGKYPDGNSTLVRGREGAVLIDPSLTVHGRGGIPDVDRVLVSHAHEDHVAGIGATAATHVHSHVDDVIGVRSLEGLLEVYGLPPDDAARFGETPLADFHIGPVPHATGFADGDVFDVGGATLEVMHLPGHTRGHSAFIIEPDGVAFVGDVDLSTFGPYYGDHWSDLEDFVSSIAKVRELDAAHYVTFHHKGIVSGRDEFLRQLDTFAAVIPRRDERLLAMLARPCSFTDLVDEGIIYRPGTRPPNFGDSVEHRSIEMHLARLVRECAVVLEGDLYRAA